MRIKKAGLIFDASYHYLDHLAPFCSLHQWPLILFDPALASYCKKHYPSLEILEEKALSSCETIVSCYPSRWLFLFFPELQDKKLLWIPHGHSDKGFKLSSFDILEKETALIYGEEMAKKIKIPYVRIGNFRLHYWKMHYQFYENLCKDLFSTILPKISSRSIKDPIYLYAPTWKDLEGNGSFPEMLKPLIENLPETVLLLIKLHPNTEKKEKALIEELKKKWEKKKNLIFLPLWTPIYPLLDLCDAFIGEISSIAYDFLYFDKPIYLFPSSIRLPLYEAAEMIDSFDLKTLFKQQDTKSLIRKTLYEKTFDPYTPYRK